ncbi:MAG TPA: PASTA domain-containing protein [Gemmatimonadales bacterium]|nr:PASTA domain-containing protein [Gemmatimonadales bacterium]
MTTPNTPGSPETPPPATPSHWAGIHREGSPTGMPRFPWSGITRTVTGRRLLIQVSIIFGCTVAGYLVAALWLYPAPLFSESVAVPRVLELDAATAEARLAAAGLRVHRGDQMPHPRIAAGSVMWQDPSPYSEVGRGMPVDLIISSGAPELAIPDVEGFDSPLALRVLAAAGLNVQRVDSVANIAPKGTALATRPAAGVTRGPTDTLTLVVSSGPASNTIPDVTNMTTDKARDRLFDAGFTLGRITIERSEGLPDGTIIRQRPAPGGLAARDSRVDVVVAGEPQ